MMNLSDLVVELQEKVEKEGVEFSSSGYASFPQALLAEDPPDEIIPFHRKQYAKAPKKRTSLCFFTDDRKIYPRLRKLDDDLDVYRQYHSVCGFDLSPLVDDPIEEQRFNVLLSQLATLYLGTKGVKIIPNFRIGSIAETIDVLNSYPARSMFAVGALGCARKNLDFNLRLLRNKLVFARPSMALVYGTLRSEYARVFKLMSVPYRVYEDYQRSARKGRNR